MTDNTQPEALRLADIADRTAWAFVIAVRRDIAAELRRLHAENQALRTAHVQNPAEIEHAAGDVSKNGAESNMSTQQPAPNAMQSLTAALKGDPEYAWAWHCNLAMPIMDNAKVSHRVANITAARLMQHLFGIDTEKHPHFEVADEAPQADSQPAQVRDERDDFEKVFPLPSGCIRVGAGYASTGYSNWAAHTHCERWQGWQARAARAPADSVTAPAGRTAIRAHCC